MKCCFSKIEHPVSSDIDAWCNIIPLFKRYWEGSYFLLRALVSFLIFILCVKVQLRFWISALVMLVFMMKWICHFICLDQCLMISYCAMRIIAYRTVYIQFGIWSNCYSYSIFTLMKISKTQHDQYDIYYMIFINLAFLCCLILRGLIS